MKYWGKVGAFWGGFWGLLFVEHPATFVPVDVRETGMRGALNGARKEAFAGTDCEPASSS
jgi:hypothetical protein